MAVKIVRKTDRIKIKIDDITIYVAPLTFHQKIEIQTCGVQASKTGVINAKELDINKMMFKTMQYSVKKIDGIEDLEGNIYELEFENDDKQSLTEECVQELMTLPCSNKMLVALMGMINGLPKGNKIYNPANNEVIDGVEIILPKKAKAVKKKKR